MKTNTPPSFQFYPDDFSSDGKVEAMTTKEVGAYILLLCKAWREDPPGTLPASDAVLARWARVTPDEWQECKPGVLAAFRLGKDGRWHSPRLKQEAQRQRESKAPRRQKGWIYILSAESGFYKIGKAKEVTKRAQRLKIQLPYRSFVRYCFEVPDHTRAETDLHKQFHHKRANGEWFSLSSEDIHSIIEAVGHKGYFEDENGKLTRDPDWSPGGGNHA